MLHKLRSLSEFEFRLALEDKVVFLYTLVFPAAYFLAISWRKFAAGGVTPASEILSNLFGFWAYIMLTGVINQITVTIFQMRENNFLKMYTFISGDKRLIYYANLIPQVMIIQIEIALFDVLAILIYRPSDRLLALIGIFWLINFILIPIIAFFTTVILILPIKARTLTMYLTGYIFAALALGTITFKSPLVTTIVTFINPVDFQETAYSLFLQHSQSLFAGTLLLVVGAAYIILGNLIISKMSLASRTSR